MSDPLSIGFISLGCAKNLVDSQVMAGVLLSEKLKLAPAPEEADIVLVNTCAFIEDARNEAAEAILRACAHKAEGNCRAVIVAGCMAQRYRERLRKAFPDVDAFLGVDELERVGEVVRRVAAGQRVLAVTDGAPRKLFAPRLPALRFSGGPFAYLKIAEGCNHACAFCAIPGIRGRHRSRPLPELVAEARTLLQAGVGELDLISQDTTSYGRDRADGGLPVLLQALDRLEGNFWLRALYGYPAHIGDELLAAMAGSRHVVPYLDVPIQHSHPDILRAMRRGDTLRAVADGPAKWRQAVPGLVLRTTCLVGFPGETEAHFQHLLDYTAAAQFDHLGVFVYSPEEGTPAFDCDGRPPEDVAEERRARLMRQQQGVVARRRASLTGTETSALLLQPEKTGKARLWVARLPRQAPDVDGVTRVAGVPEDAKPGDFVQVCIAGGHACDLTAHVRRPR